MGSRNIFERYIWFDRQTRTQRYPNAFKLAQHFEISAKTAQRDIDYMRDRLYCPLEYNSSLKGYHYTDDTFALPMIYLTAEELSALLMARSMLKDISEGAIGNEISQITDKINGVIKRHIGNEKQIDEAMSFRFVEHAPAPAKSLKAVLAGCLRRRRVEFSYLSPSHNSAEERIVDPYHLLNYMGTWHLIGYCHLRNALRDFNLMRMSDVELLEDEFVVLPSFNIRGYLNSSFGIYKGEESQDVTIRFTPERARWASGRVWHPSQVATDLNDGSLEITFPVADFIEIKMEILRHGAGVEVIGPEELRVLIVKEARNICALYDNCEDKNSKPHGLSPA